MKLFQVLLNAIGLAMLAGCSTGGSGSLAMGTLGGQPASAGSRCGDACCTDGCQACPGYTCRCIDCDGDTCTMQCVDPDGNVCCTMQMPCGDCEACCDSADCGASGKIS
jgi:hypothetical protein